MLILLIAATALICLAAPVLAYIRYRDIFHPLVFIAPMCLFLYVYMPAKLIKESELLTFVTDDEATFYQLVIALTVGALFLGALMGSAYRASEPTPPRIRIDRDTLHKGAYLFGSIGFIAFAYTIHVAGGFTAAFWTPKGGGQTDIGYVSDAAYLTIIGMVLLLSPEGWNPKNKIWLLAVLTFASPWLLYGLLGARRGPTFMITVCIGMSVFLARGKRPSIFMLTAAGAALGFLMLLLVTNRDHICFSCDLKISTDVTQAVSSVDPGNEYIFGIGCVTTAKVLNKCYWGKRYLAQVTVRAIPHQWWPTKYEDVGLADLLQNAGVAGPGLSGVMGWAEVPGSAAAMVADMWVEFSWLEVPVAFLIGWGLGRVWRLAITRMGFWMTEYVIFCILSIYFVTQSGEAIISRSVILSVPALLVWRRARKAGALLPPETEFIEIPGPSRVLHA
jgi:hypothetical protein